MPDQKRPHGKASSIRTVFLDRDGVINRKQPEGEYVTSWAEMEVLPGAPLAIRRMNEAGMRVIVVSNQRCVALGLCTRRDVEELHERLQAYLKEHGGHVDRFYFCAHDRGECDCRKPATGMFVVAVREFPSIRAESSVMMGDSFSDIEFGRRAGMRTIFIQGDQKTPKAGRKPDRVLADAVCSSLCDAVETIFKWTAV